MDEIRNSTLADWNTNGLNPGTYELTLKIRNNLGDTITSAKQIVLTSPQNGMADIELSKIILYPNPATETIQLSGQSFPTELELFNTNGESVLKEKIISPNQRIQIGALTPGMYFYRLPNSRANNFGKLVIVPGLK
jgi:hypothetical protein